MQIQLKQREIEQALRDYINAQGINTRGRSVTIGFTAGRRDSGLSADISIEDIDLPDLADDDDTVTAPPVEVKVDASKVTVDEPVGPEPMPKAGSLFA